MIAVPISGIVLEFARGQPLPLFGLAEIASPWPRDQAFARSVVPLLERGTLKPVVDRVFALDEVRAAHEYMEQNQNFGKIVLRVQ